MICNAIILYFIIISLFAIVFTVNDKKRAVKNKWRVRESTLFLLAFLGGSFAEYITMKTIRHKTKHKRFMIGLPAIMLLQVLSIFAFFILNENL